MIFLQAAEAPDTIDQLIKLIEVIIWPLTVVGALFLYRKNFKHILSRVGNFKIGPNGLEMTLLEKTLEEAKSIIPFRNPMLSANEGEVIMSKDGSRIIPKAEGDTIPKASQDETLYQTNHADTPLLELLELQEAINKKLKSVLAQNEIINTGSSNYSLTSDLENHKIINNQTTNQLKKLIELMNIGLNTPQITYDQVIQMKKLFINISI